MRSSETPTSRATWATGSEAHMVTTKASISIEKPEPLAAHGTGACEVLPHSRQATRGTRQWMKALNWKKCRCCQVRSTRSCTGWSAAPQTGQASRAVSHDTSKWIAPSSGRNDTLSTAHGGVSPKAWVKSCSCIRQG
ncbi:hypothetical protein R77592_04511 [Ralstonia mannitolilytica]|nr:hypothetical protein R77592_04511 [Ralstonia mannitolilytica]